MLVNGTDQGATNTPLTLTLRATRKVIPGSKPREFEITNPTVTARVTGYRDIEVDCDFPDV